MINPELFDFPSIFGVVKSTEGLKRNQTRPLRAEVQEIAIAKYSGGQLKYIGDKENGKDFYGTVDGLFMSPKEWMECFKKQFLILKKLHLKIFKVKI